MLNRKISVKKMFILLLVAILAMLALFFLHGPYLEPGLQDTVSQAVLAQAKPQDGESPAGGYRILLTEQKGNNLTLYGVVCYGCYSGETHTLIPETISPVTPVRIGLEKQGSDLWNIVSYDEQAADTQSEATMKELFPFLPRTILSLFGEKYADTLMAQMASQAQNGPAVSD